MISWEWITRNKNRMRMVESQEESLENKNENEDRRMLIENKIVNEEKQKWIWRSTWLINNT